MYPEYLFQKTGLCISTQTISEILFYDNLAMCGGILPFLFIVIKHPDQKHLKGKWYYFIEQF